MNTVFQLLIHAARDEGLSTDAVKLIDARYSLAKQDSIAYQKMLLEKLD